MLTDEVHSQNGPSTGEGKLSQLRQRFECVLAVSLQIIIILGLMYHTVTSFSSASHTSCLMARCTFSMATSTLSHGVQILNGTYVMIMVEFKVATLDKLAT